MTAPPREPTEAMVAAGRKAWIELCEAFGGRVPSHTTCVGPMWRAMYDAAPAPPVAQPAEPINAAAAVYMLLGELTTSYKVPLLGATSDAAPWAEIAKQFCDKHGLGEPHGGPYDAAPAPSADDPLIHAQHEETGRMWIGPHSLLPPRYQVCTAPPVAQPAEPMMFIHCIACSCPTKCTRDNVCHIQLSAQTPTEPRATDDLVRQLRDHASQFTDHSDLWGEAADLIERQAREIALHVAANEGFRERAERAEAERDKALDANARFKKREKENAEREFVLEAERDGLRELLREVLHATSPNMSMDMYAKVCAALDSARAKVGK